MNSCFKCKIKTTFPLESQVMPLLSERESTAAAAVPPGQQELFVVQHRGDWNKFFILALTDAQVGLGLTFSAGTGVSPPGCARSVMLGCCVRSISCYLAVRASSCASCRNSREMPAPVPSRPLCPPWRQSTPGRWRTRVSHGLDPCGTSRAQYPNEERAARSGAVWAFPGASEAQGLPATARGHALLPPWGQNSPTVKLGKRERFQLN